MPRDFVETFKNQTYASFIHTFNLPDNFQTRERKGKKREKTYLKPIFN